MRIWVDITDASHVVFFAPIVRRLEDAGHNVTLTARRFAGADLVLRRHGLGGVLTTGHRGGGLGTRAIGLVNRTAQLLASAASGRFDVAAGSHASDFALTAWTLGIPQMTFLDDERLRRGNIVNVRLVDEVAVPQAIPPETLAALGGRFLTLVHPTAVVAPSAVIGEGAIVCPHGIVSADAALGRCVLVNYHASVAHDAAVGDYGVLAPYATLGGFARVGADVFLGLHASVGPGRQVGDRSKVSANSCALADVPADTLVYGVPGRYGPLLS